MAVHASDAWLGPAVAVRPAGALGGTSPASATDSGPDLFVALCVRFSVADRLLPVAGDGVNVTVKVCVLPGATVVAAFGDTLNCPASIPAIEGVTAILVFPESDTVTVSDDGLLPLKVSEEGAGSLAFSRIVRVADTCADASLLFPALSAAAILK